MNEFAIHLIDGTVLFTGGFETTATLLGSIEHQWSLHNNPHYADDSLGITCAFASPGRIEQLMLIRPEHVSVVRDLRFESV